MAPILTGQEISQNQTEIDSHPSHGIGFQSQDGTRKIKVLLGERGLLPRISLLLLPKICADLAMLTPTLFVQESPFTSEFFNDSFRWYQEM